MIDASGLKTKVNGPHKVKLNKNTGCVKAVITNFSHSSSNLALEEEEEEETMSSMMETLQIRKPASLPVSQSSTTTDDEPGLLRRRLSSLSLNLSTQPSKFMRSKSVSDIGEQGLTSVKEWWEWGWSWILSRKPIFIRDLELNKEEAKSISSQNRGSIMHVFFKIRSQIRFLIGPSSHDSLPLSCKHKRQR